jgi:hypothetical protein
VAAVGAAIIAFQAPEYASGMALRLFSLFSSGPSEVSVCNAIKSTRIGDQKYSGEVTGCRKTNGREANTFGMHQYVMELEIDVFYPRGFHPECIPPANFTYDCYFAGLKIGVGGEKFARPGTRTTKKIERAFVKTERGWQGQDGKLY